MFNSPFLRRLVGMAAGTEAGMSKTAAEFNPWHLRMAITKEKTDGESSFQSQWFDTWSEESVRNWLEKYKISKPGEHGSWVSETFPDPEDFDKFQQQQNDSPAFYRLTISGFQVGERTYQTVPPKVREAWDQLIASMPQEPLNNDPLAPEDVDLDVGDPDMENRFGNRKSLKKTATLVKLSMHPDAGLFIVKEVESGDVVEYLAALTKEQVAAYMKDQYTYEPDEFIIEGPKDLSDIGDDYFDGDASGPNPPIQNPQASATGTKKTAAISGIEYVLRSTGDTDPIHTDEESGNTLHEGVEDIGPFSSIEEAQQHALNMHAENWEKYLEIAYRVWPMQDSNGSWLGEWHKTQADAESWLVNNIGTDWKKEGYSAVPFTGTDMDELGDMFSSASVKPWMSKTAGGGMKLVYEESGEPVKIGDIVKDINDDWVKIDHFREPHSPASEGKISVLHLDENKEPELGDQHWNKGEPTGGEYYVGVVGAKWIGRSDREKMPDSPSDVPTFSIKDADTERDRILDEMSKVKKNSPKYKKLEQKLRAFGSRTASEDWSNRSVYDQVFSIIFTDPKQKEAAKEIATALESGNIMIVISAMGKWEELGTYDTEAREVFVGIFGRLGHEEDELWEAMYENFKSGAGKAKVKTADVDDDRGTGAQPDLIRYPEHRTNIDPKSISINKGPSDTDSARDRDKSVYTEDEFRQPMGRERPVRDPRAFIAPPSWKYRSSRTMNVLYYHLVHSAHHFDTLDDFLTGVTGQRYITRKMIERIYEDTDFLKQVEEEFNRIKKEASSSIKMRKMAAKEKECYHCEGHGSVPCEPCDGEVGANSDCKKCDGEGVHDCPECDGMGKKYARTASKEEPGKKEFLVVSVSDNMNSFGLRGVILMSSDGEAWEVARSMFNFEDILSKGDYIEIAMTPDGPDWSSQRFEIPKKLPPVPEDVLTEVFGKPVMDIDVADPDEELDRLKGLLDKGEITKDQFNDKMRQLHGSKFNRWFSKRAEKMIHNDPKDPLGNVIDRSLSFLELFTYDASDEDRNMSLEQLRSEGDEGDSPWRELFIGALLNSDDRDQVIEGLDEMNGFLEMFEDDHEQTLQGDIQQALEGLDKTASKKTAGEWPPKEWPRCNSCGENVPIIDGVFATHGNPNRMETTKNVPCHGSGQKPESAGTGSDLRAVRASSEEESASAKNPHEWTGGNMFAPCKVCGGSPRQVGSFSECPGRVDKNEKTAAGEEDGAACMECKHTEDKHGPDGCTDKKVETHSEEYQKEFHGVSHPDFEIDCGCPSFIGGTCLYNTTGGECRCSEGIYAENEGDDGGGGNKMARVVGPIMVKIATSYDEKYGEQILQYVEESLSVDGIKADVTSHWDGQALVEPWEPETMIPEDLMGHTVDAYDREDHEKKIGVVTFDIVPPDDDEDFGYPGIGEYDVGNVKFAPLLEKEASLVVTLAEDDEYPELDDVRDASEGCPDCGKVGCHRMCSMPKGRGKSETTAADSQTIEIQSELDKIEKFLNTLAPGNPERDEWEARKTDLMSKMPPKPKRMQNQWGSRVAIVVGDSDL